MTNSYNHCTKTNIYRNYETNCENDIGVILIDILCRAFEDGGTLKLSTLLNILHGMLASNFCRNKHGFPIKI